MVVENHDELSPHPLAETWYTLGEAAVIARRTVIAMRQLRVKGKGPRFRKVDGRLLVSSSELRRWLNGEDSVKSPAPLAPLEVPVKTAAAKKATSTKMAAAKETTPRLIRRGRT
jgi:hypothetical protein